MAIKIAAWNTENRLAYYLPGSRGTPTKILEGIRKLDADIIVLPEAYVNAPASGADELLKTMGYSWEDVRYDDKDREEEVARWGFPYMRVLWRIPVRSVTLQRWGDVRSLMTLVATDPETKREIQIIGTHLEDRSEALRLKQLDEIVPFIQASKFPVVMLGDFNAMWHEKGARILASRSVRQLARALPEGDLHSTATRLSDMATGKVMKRLRDEAGLHDSDRRHRPTTTPKMRHMSFMPSIRLAQIDHILASKEVKVSDFRIRPDGGSDHRAISATLYSIRKK